MTKRGSARPTRRHPKGPDHGPTAHGGVRRGRLGIGVLAAMLALGGSGVPTQAAPQDCAHDDIHIEVSIANVRSSRGLIAAVLYDGNPGNFLASGRSVSKTRAPAQQGVYRICVDAPAPGNYALIIYHDENGNREFDMSFFGGPEEGVGFSNNPPSGNNIPDHHEVVFPVDAEVTEIDILLRYP